MAFSQEHIMHSRIFLRSYNDSLKCFKESEETRYSILQYTQAKSYLSKEISDKQRKDAIHKVDTKLIAFDFYVHCGTCHLMKKD